MSTAVRPLVLALLVFNLQSRIVAAPASVAVSAGQLIIGEFRLNGPAGINDEFIEIYNATTSPITVAASDASFGLGIAASDGILRCIIPNGTVIPALGHFLCANNTAGTGYSLGGYAAPNATYTTNIADNAGIGLFTSTTNFSAATKLDAVGSVGEGNPLFKEGTGYPTLAALSIQQTLFRKLDLTDGRPTDTDNNANDFFYSDTAATNAGLGRHLGAPGPKNLTSPIQRNATLKTTLIDPGAAPTALPNRVRDNQPNVCGGPNCPLGTLDIRRKITNSTGAPVTRLRFRIAEVTTAIAPAGTADLRALTSTDVTVTLTGGGTTLVRGLTLETPAQQSGGGYNSSVAVGVVTVGTPLANGASVNVRFLFGVVQNGNSEFLFNVESVP